MSKKNDIKKLLEGAEQLGDITLNVKNLHLHFDESSIHNSFFNEPEDEAAATQDGIGGCDTDDIRDGCCEECDGFQQIDNAEMFAFIAEATGLMPEQVEKVLYAQVDYFASLGRKGTGEADE